MPRKARKFLKDIALAKQARLVRASESFEAREARLEANKIRNACRRKNKSAEEREARLENSRLGSVCQQENESADEREARLEADRIRVASKRKAEKETEHYGTQAKRARLKRASESFEAREARLEKDRFKSACRREYESTDEREARQAKDRLRRACRRENESADEREARLEAMRIRVASKRKAEKETEHHVAREENMKAQLASQIENQNSSLGLIHVANSHRPCSLIVQMRTRHKVNEECRMVFTREDEHDEYMRTHAEGKPFACVYCGKGFTEKTDLSIHVGEHRREMGLDAEESPTLDNTHSRVEMTVKDEPEEEWTSFAATGMDCEGNGTHRLTSEMCSSYSTESSVNQEIESSEFETVYVKCEDIPSCSSEMDRSPAMRDDPLISGEKDAAESDKTSNF